MATQKPTNQVLDGNVLGVVQQRISTPVATTIARIIDYRRDNGRNWLSGYADILALASLAPLGTTQGRQTRQAPLTRNR